MTYGGLPAFRTLPEIVTGYELTREGWFDIVVPEACTNLIPNPSFEVSTSTGGWTAVNATFARNSAYQTRGVYSCQITPVISANETRITLTISGLATLTRHTYAIDVLAWHGESLWISAAGTGPTVEVAFTGTGQWTRQYVTFEMAAGGSALLTVRRAGGSAKPYYVDGAQLEAKPYQTTYVDGEQDGLLRFNPLGEPAYLWAGTPHNSSSVRIASTRAGGRVVDFADLGLILAGMIGLGMAPLTNYAVPLGNGGGSLYQTTLEGERPFALVGQLASPTYAGLEATRQAIIDTIKPNVAPIPQPCLILYQATDECDEEIGEPLEIVAAYESGMEGNTASRQAENVTLQFKAFLPQFRTTRDTGAAFTLSESFPTIGRTIYRDAAGDWSLLGVGLNGNVNAMVRAVDGSIYVAGQFTTAGGGAAANIARWTPSTGTWTALGTGLTGGIGTELALDSLGRVYVAGTFTAAGGVANTLRIARWDPATSTWAALSTGLTGAYNSGGALAYSPLEDALYVVGEFTAAGGVPAVRVAKWNIGASTWSAIGTGAGFSSSPGALGVGRDGLVYVGGSFNTVDGITANGTASYNPTTNTFAALGAGTPSVVQSILVARDGTVYFGGNFTAIGGITANRIGRWTGSTWQSVGTFTGITQMLTITQASNGDIIAGGSGGTLEGVSNLGRWTGSAWLPIEFISVVGQFNVLIAGTRPEELYAAGSFTSGTTGASNVVNYAGSADTYPKIRFTGPGRIVSVSNLTTGERILFTAGATLAPSEIAILDFSQPGAIRFESQFRNLLTTIVKGSSGYLRLTPGANTIVVLMTSTGAGTEATLYWRGREWATSASLP